MPQNPQTSGIFTNRLGRQGRNGPAASSIAACCRVCVHAAAVVDRRDRRALPRDSDREIRPASSRAASHHLLPGFAVPITVVLSRSSCGARTPRLIAYTPHWQDISRQELTTAWTGGLGRLMTATIQARALAREHTRSSFGDAPSLAAAPVSDSSRSARQPRLALAAFDPSIGPRQVWVCVLDPNLPPSCGGGVGGVACYVFDEAVERFFYWGPNTVLRLVDKTSPGFDEA
jgi:hypothetical protein